MGKVITPFMLPEHFVTGNTKPPVMVAELVDNAIDAGSATVEIRVGKQQLEVIDLGKGCPDIELMLRIGQRMEMETTRSGVYAIGGKEAMMSLGKTVFIESVCGDKRWSAFVEWAKVVNPETREWVVDDPVESPANGAKTGTTVRIVGLHTEIRAKRLAEQLAWRYAPGLSSGKLQIRIANATSKGSGTPIPKPSGPTLEDVIEVDKIETPGGRHLSLRAGLLSRADQGRDEHVTLALETRVIARGIRLGLGDDPTPGLHVMVTLLGDRRGWGVTRNKDGVSEKRLGDIAQVIATHAKGLIEKARERGSKLCLESVNQRLRGVLALPKREKRKSPAPRGGKRPKDTTPTGIERTKASQVQDKPGKIRVPGRPDIVAYFVDREPEAFLFEVADNLVAINRSHPCYQHYGDEMDWGLPVLIFLAGHCSVSGQLPLSFDDLVREHAQSRTEQLRCLTSVFGANYIRNIKEQETTE